MKKFTVTVEYDFYAADEEDARSTNFYCQEICDEGMVVAVEELAPKNAEVPA